MTQSRVAILTGNDEWYTPAEYLNAAVDVMGGIDLDPASCETAQTNVLATRYYTQADNGLGQQWSGRVWLNPPYSRPLMGQFIDKLVDSYEAGDVTQAVLLTHSTTDTAWFHRAAEACSALCLTRGRIKFLNRDMVAMAAPTHGTAFFYFGRSVPMFGNVFGEFGQILTNRALVGAL